MYSNDQQQHELRENIHTEQEKYEQAIKAGKPLREAKKIFTTLKKLRYKLLKQSNGTNRPQA